MGRDWKTAARGKQLLRRGTWLLSVLSVLLALGIVVLWIRTRQREYTLWAEAILCASANKCVMIKSVNDYDQPKLILGIYTPWPASRSLVWLSGDEDGEYVG